MSAHGFDFGRHMADVARALLGEPDKTYRGGEEWRYGQSEALSVMVGGPKAGTWHDKRDDQGGGVLALIRRERGFANGEALDWLRDEIGADIPERGRGRPSTADYARQLAGEMRPLSGTPAEAYLRETRGLSGPFPADLGFHPSVRAKAGGDHPALLCVARDGEGAVQFVHVVFLNDEGQKAGFSPPKQTFAKMEGAAFRIPATTPTAGARMVLAEGPEDALSWAQATGLETWACCGVANIGKVDPPHGAEVIVAAQNDPADKEATKTLHKAVRRLRGRGLRVIVAPPPDGTKDANDLLREAGPGAVREALASAEERAGWRADLIYGANGRVAPVLANAIIALTHDDQWHGVLGYDEFACRVVMRRPAPWLIDGRGKFAEREWTDLDDLRAAEWLQVRGILVSHEVTGRAVQRAASDHPFHPVREWLDSLKWDGVPRLDTWLTTHLSTEDTAYTRAVAAKFLIGAVARIYRPGVKADTCIILEGRQGLLKSSALRSLVGDAWFSDQMPDLGSKDSMVQVQGKWVIELAELDSLSRGEVSRVKAFMSTQVDRFRPPYGKRASDHPRQCVFAGSTNQDDYLRDETGGRRFWPVRCGVRIDLAGIERDRAQLWAEAVVRFKAGEAWWLDDVELVRKAEEEQAERYHGDPWDARVAAYLCDKQSVTVAEVLSHLGLEVARQDQATMNRVVRILRSRKWHRRYVGTRAAREWRYFPPVCHSDAPCSSSGGESGTREAPEKSTPCSSVPVCSTLQETSLEETRKIGNRRSGSDFSSDAHGKVGGEPAHTGTPAHGIENAGLSRVPVGAEDWNTLRDQEPDWNTADDADAEERLAIQEFDGAEPAPPPAGSLSDWLERHRLLAPSGSACATCGLGDLPGNVLMNFADGGWRHGWCPPAKERERLMRQQARRPAAGPGASAPA